MGVEVSQLRFFEMTTNHRLSIGFAFCLAVFAWSYWPTLVELEGSWGREPDYSHGYFVLPLALYFLWLRRDTFPAGFISPDWGGLLLIAASVLLRFVGLRFFLGISIEGWSMLVWVAGMAWLFGGQKFLRWSLPAIAFLFFMIPLPYRAERMLSLPLQRVATVISTTTLQLLGQPAFAEGNTIILGDEQLEVAQACSGLRILVGIIALAFAFVIATRRPIWERVTLVVSSLPIALVANSCRIVTTGLLYQYSTGDVARKFAHDLSGWFMIPLAVMLFALLMKYCDKLFNTVEVAKMEFLKQQMR